MRTDLHEAISTYVDSTRTQYMLGHIQATQEDHARRICDREADHKAIRAEVDKLKTWAERAGILALLYILGTGLHLSAGTMGPIIGAAIKGVAGLK